MRNVLFISINEFPIDEVRPKREVTDSISIDPTVHPESIKYAIDTLTYVKEKLEKLLK